jgi:succinate dehydrogenase / fumarate reductase flavoprotein subunit
MIRTLQDHAIHRGITVYMEHTILTLLEDGERKGRVRLRE